MATARPFDIRVESDRSDGAAVVHVAGDIDLATSDRLREVLLPLVGRGTVVVDAAQITFCDSAGLRVILLANHEARDRHTVFRLVAPSEPLTRVLELAGALPLVDVFPDAGSALQG
ncbi:MAG TPA: STAS domain-containing protein [Actinocrinis sp.]|jgi:anti-anti-sigma factor|uniref:STAS domain-containing protein n=1 Tax=Actinocrinis sp. TaxID=1920516 RepID=UPI002DDD73AF|nr:STAS domain-containing protein [Actinocrinis sp.]HEV3171314.1 STAS domain-containing protein [Actinocrinis sp.]